MNKILISALLLLVSVILYQQWYYNLNVRRNILSDSSHLFISGTYIISVLRKDPLLDQDLDLLVRTLTQEVSAHSGEITYLGRVVDIVLESKQFDLESADVLLVTTWTNPPDFTRFRSSLSGWAEHRVQGMTRNSLLNLLVPHGLFLLRLKTYLFGQHNLTEEASFWSNSDDDSQQVYREKVSTMLPKISAGDSNEAIMIWNWLQDGTAEQVNSDLEYSLKMMEMLAQHGGGLMNIGQTSSVEGVRMDGNFERVASVYYPGRKFFSKMIKSDWMRKTIRGKQLGDTLAVLTVPYYKRQPAVEL